MNPLTLYGALGALAIIVGLGVVVKVQSARLEAANVVVDGFKQAGELALKLAKGIDARNKSKKEKADADYKRTNGALQRDNQRLRDSANSSSLPSPSATTGDPNRIAFDRPELDAAIRRFTAGTAAIATEGAEAVNALDNAKAWAQSQ